jgi:hypothetical protein
VVATARQPPNLETTRIDTIAQQATKGGLKMIAKVIVGVVALGIGLIAVLAIAAQFLDAPSTRIVGGPPLVLMVHRGTRGLRVTNDTDVAWDLCRVTLLGDYRKTIDVLKPRASAEVYYKDFGNGNTALDEDDGYTRALRSLTIRCTGPDDQQREAIIR